MCHSPVCEKLSLYGHWALFEIVEITSLDNVGIARCRNIFLQVSLSSYVTFALPCLFLVAVVFASFLPLLIGFPGPSLQNCVEQHDLELCLPASLFSCPLASGKETSLPVLTVPSGCANEDEEEIEEDSVSASHPTDGHSHMHGPVLVESQAPQSVRILHLWQQYISCVGKRLSMVESQGKIQRL